jgi:primary-amine oxidase
MSTERVRRHWKLPAFAVSLTVLAIGVVLATPSSGGLSREETSITAATAGPLDSLSADEIATTFKVIEASKQFPKGAFFPTVVLNEPSKSQLSAWSPGHPFARQAFANVYDHASNRVYEAVVDLRTKKLVSWTLQPNAEPAVFFTEYQEVDDLVRADPRWQKAMRDRNIDPDDVYLDAGWAVGDLTVPGVKPGTRLLRALSFFQGNLANPYDRPIEGVVVTVDMNRLKVVQVIDTGARPVNTTITGNAGSTRTGLRPLVVTQPDGPSFDISGNAVSWQGWHFRVGFSQREGLVLHQIGYGQNGVVRPIIHRLSLNEIYVPYGIPDSTWAWRAALDVGEYNLGQLAMSLEPGVDVPDNAVFFDEASPNDQGSAGDPPAYDLPNAIAIYEQDAGTLWERTDPTTLDRDARFGRELVVTAGYANGNYTYLSQYVFRMDGGIDVRAGATGTTLNQGVTSVAQGNQYGTSVAPTIAAPSHQHFFNFRIDFDVDGTQNRLVEENEQSVPSDSGNAFVTNQTAITTEGFRDVNPSTDRRWVVESATRTDALGEPTGYELDPADATHPYSSPGFAGLQRAAFANHALWVTQYQGDELYASGAYPNQSAAGTGLPQYVADHGSVDGRDLVVWYTASFTHHPAVEEYPVMTADTVGFTIRPDGFFDQNPALDAP